MNNLDKVKESIIRASHGDHEIANILNALEHLYHAALAQESEIAALKIELETVPCECEQCKVGLERWRARRRQP